MNTATIWDSMRRSWSTWDWDKKGSDGVPGSMRRIAIIGGGPTGLELALRARHEGHDVIVYEAGRVGEHFARYGSVRLFTPFHMNSTPLGRELMRRAGARLPEDEEILTANDLRERYL